MSRDAITSAAPPPIRRDRAVQLWAVSKGVSDAGDAAWIVAVAWSAVQLADPATAGLVVAAGTLPRAVALLLGGVLADRVDTVAVLFRLTLARIVVLGAAIVIIAAQGLSIPLLIVVAVAFGICDAIFEPAAFTLGRQLVRPDDLPSYSALMQTASRLGTLAGGAAGGFLVATGGLRSTAAANLATYVGVLVAVHLVLTVRFPIARTATTPILRSLASGFTHLREHASTRRLVLTLSGLNLAVGPALGLGLALRVQDSARGATVLGALQALVGLGAIIGALALFLRRPEDPARVGFGLLLLQGLSIVALAVPGLPVAVVACLLIGVTSGAASVMLSALIQRVAAPDFLGRLASIQRLGDDVLMPVAMIGFGALAAGASLPVAFVAFGAAMSALMLATLLRTPRPHEDTTQEVAPATMRS